MRTLLLATICAVLSALLLVPSSYAQRSQPFSSALAVDGDEVLVGGPSHPHAPGRVYTFVQDDNAWRLQSHVSAEDGDIGDGFGSSIAVSESRMIVGAPAAMAAYVFERSDDGSWKQAARLAATDSTSGFGTSVAIDGSRAVVGAPSSSVNAAYVFERGTDGWMQTATLTGSDARDGSRFGATVAISGDHVLAGAPGNQSGTVFRFAHDADAGEWGEIGQITRDRLERGAQFGSSLALRRTANGTLHLVVGAPREGGRTGAAYTFTYDAESDTWRTIDRLLPFDGEARHSFGYAVAFDGDNVWVGAPGAADRAGTLYHFERSTTGTWSSVQRVAASDVKPNIGLGTTIAASNGMLLAGQPGDVNRTGTAAVISPDENGRWAMSSVLDPGPYDVLSKHVGERMNCEDGTSAGRYSCEQVDMASFIPVHEIGGGRGNGLNDIWGWTDPETGREYALVGRFNGTSFVDVTDPGAPVFVGQLPMTEGSRPNVWRDMKVYKDHVYVVADNAGAHGMQVFDLTQLRDVADEDMPMTFSQTAHYDNVNSSHNVVINEETGYAYIVGAGGGGETCGGGLHMVDIRTPTEPTFAGCFADPSTGRTGTGYTHDAQCVIYNGPDTEHQGKEICFGANETAISIADISTKDSPVAISTGSYPDHAYVHQGWLDPQQSYYYVNDELDEINGLVDRTRTLVWDVSDLDDPQLVKEFLLPERSSDHNLYIIDDVMYQSNYVSGLRIIDISNRTEPAEIGHFDTVPFGDNSPGFGGSWSNYPFFESGTIVVTSMNEGLFVLKRSQQGL
jgi:choice-of-anchor B domain-containing protein